MKSNGDQDSNSLTCGIVIRLLSVVDVAIEIRRDDFISLNVVYCIFYCMTCPIHSVEVEVTRPLESLH